MAKNVMLNGKKRLASLLGDLAQSKHMSMGEMLEETVLHTFEKLPGGGVTSPHTAKDLSFIHTLKAKHGITCDCHASYRFIEKTRID